MRLRFWLKRESLRRHSFPKADALPGCATPRMAETKGYGGLTQVLGKGETGQNEYNRAKMGDSVSQKLPQSVLALFAGAARRGTGRREGWC